MRSMIPLVAAACLLFAAVPSHATRVRRGPTSGKQHHPPAKAKEPAHQRAIDDTRATQIQGALVKAGYLKETSGHWDATSEAAMQKLQADNGWQTKIIPDSRALIKLGLGPNEASEAAPAHPGPGQGATSGSDTPGSK
jgi:hypothetical protein